jgi:hypothetical protein
LPGVGARALQRRMRRYADGQRKLRRVRTRNGLYGYNDLPTGFVRLHTLHSRSVQSRSLLLELAGDTHPNRYWTARQMANGNAHCTRPPFCTQETRQMF